MITILVFASFTALLSACLHRLGRSMPAAPAGAAAPAAAAPAEPPPEPAGHPESMTAELDQEDEEYLAGLAADLWPEDEYLEMERTGDGEEEAGGNMAF
ncbi:hypothetical protein [Actinomadura parmotrematis]|uniref:Secreted protein n=1 Tax=Actinomadura parmotrematis TaxID=2864039 RepID=A0ABS7G130_9ACTN|nr:hypothetical protein [Actinomadura parmotrematis]MBW8485574.1 hypothetical protein [Actinomadura parmotrematis]